MPMRPLALAFALVTVRVFAALPPMPVEWRADAAAAVAAAAAVTAAGYPDAHSVMVDDRLHSRYETDGTYCTWDDEYVKVLTERGRRQLSTVSLWVSRRYGEAEIQAVEIIGTNGVVRTVDFSRTLAEATDNGSTAVNIYDPLDRVITCAVPTLAVGEVRHVVTCRRISKPRMRGEWFDCLPLEATYPIVKTVVSVDAPESRPLSCVRLRHPGAGTFAREEAKPIADGRLGYRWQVTDVPQYFPEPRMPSAYNCVQTLYLSTLEGWPAVSRWYWSMCVPHLERTTPVMAEFVRRTLAAAGSDRLAQVRSLYKFVSQEVRYMGLTLEDTAPGYEPHDVSLTFENRYGVCRDKAALLVALLRLAGFEAYPTLINVGVKMDAEAASPYFNHAIVAVRAAAGEFPGEMLANGYLLMDPTNEATKDIFPAYLANRSFLVARADGEALALTPATPVERNLLAIEGELRLSPDGSGLAHYHADFAGLNDSRYRGWFEGFTPRERLTAVKSLMAADYPGAELVALTVTPSELKDTDTPLKLDFTMRFPSLVRRGEESDVLSVPFFSRALNPPAALLSNAFSLDRRRFPLVFVSTLGVRERMTVVDLATLGPLLALPNALTLGGEKLGYALRRSAEAEGATIRMEREELLSGMEFSPDAYQELRQLRERGEIADREELRFASRPFVDCDSRVLRQRTEITFVSPWEWAETNLVVRELLTSAGKRECAEFKFGYHPAFQSAGLVTGAVYGRDGAVSLVSTNEINVLDADWAAEAPRYPKALTCVVSCPRVEIGSVISTVVARVSHSPSPIAFGRVFDFCGHEAVDERELVIRLPPAMELETRLVRPEVAGVQVRDETAEDGSRTIVYSLKRLKPLAAEPSVPAAELTDALLAVTARPSTEFLRALGARLADARSELSEAVAAKACELTEDLDDPEAKIAAIRRYLTRHVRRVTGISPFAMPLQDSYFPPDRVLAEGYASSLDYANLFRTMLEAAGFEVELMLSMGDMGEDDRRFGFYDETRVFPSEMTLPVLNAVWRTGWWWWAGERCFMIDPSAGEYAPVGACRLASSHVGSLDDGSFRRLGAVADEWRERSERRQILTIATNGAARLEFEMRLWGQQVGDLRRRFVEMRPEIKRRLAMSMAAKFARNATVEGELEVDVRAYPARMKVTFAAPNFAVVQAGTMTVRSDTAETIAAELDDFLPSLGAGRRERPIAVAAAAPVDERVEVVLPPGWTEIESLPGSFELTFPGEAAPWAEQSCDAAVEADGRLHVRFRRHREIPVARTVSPLAAGELSEWMHRLMTPANYTISVRRP